MYFSLQHEREQVMTTNVWLTQVSHFDLRYYNTFINHTSVYKATQE